MKTMFTIFFLMFATLKYHPYNRDSKQRKINANNKVK